MFFSSDILEIVFSFVLCFTLSNLIAYTYELTFKGLSYSRNFVQSMILGSMVAVVVMLAIGDNMARGLGLMGALAIIRFRTNIKDPKDIIFIFACLAVGIATGSESHLIALVGTLAFCVSAFFISNSPIGKNTYFDGVLRYSTDAHLPSEKRELIENLFRKHCRKFVLITVSEQAQGQRMEYAYQVKFKKLQNSDLMLSELKGVDSVQGTQLLIQEATIEL